MGNLDCRVWNEWLRTVTAKVRVDVRGVSRIKTGHDALFFPQEELALRNGFLDNYHLSESHSVKPHGTQVAA